MPTKGTLFEVDVHALTDIVETLFWCHVKCEVAQEFPAVLERLRANIKGPQWQRRIQYLQAFCALWPDWNEDRGRRELGKLGFPNADDDVETIQLYLELFSEQLSFSQKQTLIDRVLAETEKLSDRIHYTGARANLYLIIGDAVRAASELTEIIEEVRRKYPPEELDIYERYRFATAVSFLGMIRRDQSTIAEAVAVYQDLLKEEDLTDDGRANLHWLIADSCRHMRDWEAAKRSYEQAIELKPDPVYRVFLADCLLQLRRGTEASTMLSAIDQSGLDQAGKLDYAFVQAAIAIDGGEHEPLVGAKAALQALTVNEPFFRKRRDADLLAIQEVLLSGGSQPLGSRPGKVLADLARSASSYLILKPSFMGLGVDLGRILEDLTKRRAKRRKTDTDKNPAKR